MPKNKTRDRASEFVTAKGMEINPKLQKELDKLYLQFLVSTIAPLSQNFQRGFPNQTWFHHEVGSLIKKIWPGMSKAECFDLIQKIFLDEIKLREQKNPNSAISQN